MEVENKAIARLLDVLPAQQARTRNGRRQQEPRPRRATGGQLSLIRKEAQHNEGDGHCRKEVWQHAEEIDGNLGLHRRVFPQPLDNSQPRQRPDACNAIACRQTHPRGLLGIPG
jgi:hypothetical protein